MGWLIAAGIVLLLAIMPISVKARYDARGFVANLVIGPFKTRLYPKTKPVKKKEKTVKNKKKSGKVVKTTKERKSTGSIQDFQGIVREIISFLGTFRRKLTVRNLELYLVLAGDDPADLAQNYGRAWAAAGNLIPQLERVFFIKKREVSIDCDFLAEQTKVSMELDAVISLGRMIVISGWHGFHILREFIKLKNLRKGGNNV